MKSSSNDVTAALRPARATLAPHFRAVSLLAAGAVLALLLPIGCMEPGKCKEIKERRYAERRAYETCEPGVDECMIIGGAQTDCTGVYFCNTAINKRFRDPAEQAVIGILADAPQCSAVCAQLACPIGENAICDRVTKRCLIVTSEFSTPPPPPVIDSGSGGPFPNPPDAGDSQDSGGD